MSFNQDSKSHARASCVLAAGIQAPSKIHPLVDSLKNNEKFQELWSK